MYGLFNEPNQSNVKHFCFGDKAWISQQSLTKLLPMDRHRSNITLPQGGCVTHSRCYADETLNLICLKINLLKYNYIKLKI